MTTNDVPQFPRGFILSESPIDPPPTYIPGPLLPNFYVHPWTQVDVAGNDDLFVVILGTCVSTNASITERPADRLLSKLTVGEAAFFFALDNYAGRHAIIFGSRSAPKIVTDATAMRSVFYASEGGLIASHALLVERALGGDPERNVLPFRYGFPGNRTPYTRTRLLTANTYYDIALNCVRRFWPRTEPASLSVDCAAEAVLEREAMADYRIGGGYDRPLPRRIAEDAGVPRDAFGFKKSMGSVLLKNAASQRASAFWDLVAEYREGAPSGLLIQ